MSSSVRGPAVRSNLLKAVAAALLHNTTDKQHQQGTKRSTNSGEAYIPHFGICITQGVLHGRHNDIHVVLEHALAAGANDFAEAEADATALFGLGVGEASAQDGDDL